MDIFLFLLGCSLHMVIATMYPKRPLHIGSLVPFIYQTDRFCFQSAIKVATKQVNEDPTILPEYEIVMHIEETAGRVGFTMHSLYELLYQVPPKVAVIGPGYSAPTIAAAEVCTIRGTLQISYAAVDPTLISKINYPFFFRTTPSSYSFNKATISLLRYFNWKHISLLYDYTQSLNYHAVDQLSKQLNAHNFTTLSVSGFSSLHLVNVDTQMEKIKALDARIIFANFNNHGAKKIFCEAYRRKMYGPKYVWIVSQGLSADWYKDTRRYACNSTEISTAAEGHFTTRRADLRSDGKATIANKTAKEIWELVKAEKRSLASFNIPDNSPLFYEGASFAFDAVWAIAKSLDAATKTPYHHNYSNFAYQSYKQLRELATTLEKINFEGVSGSVKYDINARERLGEILFRQFRNGTYVSIGFHKTADDEIEIYEDIKTLFPDGYVPRDRATIVFQPLFYSTELLGSVWGLALSGFVLACGFLLMNVRYRNVKAIKMSSPTINNVICIGCIMFYLSVLLYGLDTQWINKNDIPFSCNMIAILLAVGFTLSFGGLFSKTWRVYKIFTASKFMGRVAIKDFHLLGIIFILLVIDVGIYGLWMVISPFELKTKELERIEDIKNDIITIPYINKCQCKYQAHFTSCLYAYKGLLLVFGLFLAWETRNVSVPVLNDSRFIGMAIYNVAVLSAVGIVCTTALSNTANHEAGYVIVAICLCLGTTVTLLLIFMPKLRTLMLNEADATKSFSHKTGADSANTTSTNVVYETGEHKESVVDLKSDEYCGEEVDYEVDNLGYEPEAGVWSNDSLSTSNCNVWMGPCPSDSPSHVHKT